MQRQLSSIAYLEISGKGLKRDILRGTEIDLAFEISESRDLTVHAYVNPSGPEFSQIFTPTSRDVNLKALTEEVRMLDEQLEKEKAEAMGNENYEAVEKMEKLTAPVQELQGEVMLRRTPDFLVGWFQHLLTKRETFNDQLQAKNLIEAGKKHIAAEDYEKLGEVNGRLHSLLPEKEKDSNEMRHFTGIS
jgi:hypothetical protein